MTDDNFEWDDDKAEDNYVKHGVSFDVARKLFDDPFALDAWTIGPIIARSGSSQLAWSMVKFSSWLILNAKGVSGSSRPDMQQGMSKMTTSKGTPRPLRSMSLEEIETAAHADPDAQPVSREDLARMQPLPRARTIRRALGLSQEEFAARYHIPIGTLRDWEQGVAQPDEAARAYLTVIARDPEGVRKALEPRYSRQ